MFVFDGTLFIIKIKNNGANQHNNYCLNIRDLSLIPDEEPVLISCHCYFSITDIQKEVDNNMTHCKCDLVYLDCEGYNFD